MQGEFITSANASDLVLPIGQRDRIQGSLSAPIVLVEYGDYQCPFCAEAVGIVQKLQNQFREKLCFSAFSLTQTRSGDESNRSSGGTK